jgi:hypothetical protein
MKVWRTTDGGQHWEKKHEESIFGMNVSGFKISSTDANHAWICGAGKKIISTNDGGNTWLTHDLPAENNIASFCIHFADSLHGYCGGQYSASEGIYKTDDSGNTWTIDLQGNAWNVKSISFVDSAHIWAVGYPSFISKYGADYTTSSNSSPETNLPVSVFPNPAKAFIILRAQENLRSKIDFELIDPSGKRIMAGNWDSSLNILFRLNTSELKPGIYFLNLFSGKLRSTYKLIRY